MAAARWTRGNGWTAERWRGGRADIDNDGDHDDMGMAS